MRTRTLIAAAALPALLAGCGDDGVAGADTRVAEACTQYRTLINDIEADVLTVDEIRLESLAIREKAAAAQPVKDAATGMAAAAKAGDETAFEAAAEDADAACADEGH